MRNFFDIWQGLGLMSQWFTSPNYWGYNFQQIFVLVMWNKSPKRDINPNPCLNTTHLFEDRNIEPPPAELQWLHRRQRLHGLRFRPWVTSASGRNDQLGIGEDTRRYLVGGLNPSEKYESQLGWLFPIYGKIKNVPNHQPDGNDFPNATRPN